VLYLPQDPADARVDSFRDVWFNAVFTAIIAIVCLLIATAMWLYTFARKRRAARIIAAGTPLRAQIIETIPVKNIVIFGAAPCRLRVRTRDPRTGGVREFLSGYLWNTPKIEVGKAAVTVYVQHDDPAKYLVDLDSIQALPAFSHGPSTTGYSQVSRV